jgi:hypothetical protein
VLATVLPIENLPVALVLIRVRNQSARERYRTGLSREQMCLWVAGYPKTPGCDVRFGVIMRRTQSEHNRSAYAPITDIQADIADGREVPEGDIAFAGAVIPLPAAK